MRVGILTASYPPNRDGVSVSVAALVDGLRSRGHQVAVVTPRAKGDWEYPAHVLPVRSFPVPGSFSLELRLPYGGLRSAVRFLSDSKIDVLHSVDPFLTGPLGIAFSKLLGVPHLHAFHTHLETYPYLQFPGYPAAFRLMARQVCNLCDAVVAPTAKIATYLRRIGVSVPIHQLLNVPPPRTLYPAIPGAPQATIPGLSPDDAVFVTFGRVAKEKGLERAIAALSVLMRRHPRVKYLIAGHGPEIPALRTLARDLGVAQQVLFSGPYERSDLPALCARALAFVFTSRTDTQAITLLEAMQCGLPVVSIDDDCVDYLLRHGHNGFKVRESQLAKACARLVEHADLRQRFAAEAAKTAAGIDRESILDGWVQGFQSLLEP